MNTADIQKTTLAILASVLAQHVPNHPDARQERINIELATAVLMLARGDNPSVQAMGQMVYEGATPTRRLIGDACLVKDQDARSSRDDVLAMIQQQAELLRDVALVIDPIARGDVSMMNTELQTLLSASLQATATALQGMADVVKGVGHG